MFFVVVFASMQIPEKFQVINNFTDCDRTALDLQTFTHRTYTFLEMKIGTQKWKPHNDTQNVHTMAPLPKIKREQNSILRALVYLTKM